METFFLGLAIFFQPPFFINCQLPPLIFRFIYQFLFYTGNSFAVLYCIIPMTALASCTRRHFVRENELHQRQMPISNLINFPQRFGILAFEIIFILSYRKNFHSTPLLYKIRRKLSPNNNNYLAPMGSFQTLPLSLCRHQKGSGTFPENLLPSSALSLPRRK